MISANGGLPAHRYTPQVTHRWSRGSKPASPLFCFAFFFLPPACLFVCFFFRVLFFASLFFFCAVLAVWCRAGVSWAVGRVGVCCCGPCASAGAGVRLCSVFCVGFVLVVLTPPPPGGWLCSPVFCFVVRRVVWCCGLWCVLCCVRCCVACLCSCAVLCWAVLCCCCGDAFLWGAWPRDAAVDTHK